MSLHAAARRHPNTAVVQPPSGVNPNLAFTVQDDFRGQPSQDIAPPKGSTAAGFRFTDGAGGHPWLQANQPQNKGNAGLVGSHSVPVGGGATVVVPSMLMPRADFGTFPYVDVHRIPDVWQCTFMLDPSTNVGPRKHGFHMCEATSSATLQGNIPVLHLSIGDTRYSWEATNNPQGGTNNPLLTNFGKNANGLGSDVGWTQDWATPLVWGQEYTIRIEHLSGNTMKLVFPTPVVGGATSVTMTDDRMDRLKQGICALLPEVEIDPGENVRNGLLAMFANVPAAA